MRQASSRPNARLISIDQAADEYGIAPGSLRRLIAARELASVELPGIRRVFLRREDLDALIEESTRAAA
jgi:excisionase family DNA binding protein